MVAIKQNGCPIIHNYFPVINGAKYSKFKIQRKFERNNDYEEELTTFGNTNAIINIIDNK